MSKQENNLPTDEQNIYQQQSNEQNEPSEVEPSKAESTSISSITNDRSHPLYSVNHLDKLIEMDKQNGHHSGDQKTTGNWDKFCLVMWKNGLLQWRHKWPTIIQIFLPVLFCNLLVFFRGAKSPVPFSNSTYYQPFEIDKLNIPKVLNQSSGEIIKEMKLAYTPKNQIFETLLTEVVKSLKLDGVVSANSTEELEFIISDKKLLAGVEFEHSKSITELPKKLNYKLRFPLKLRTKQAQHAAIISLEGELSWSTNSLFPVFSASGPRNKGDNDGGPVWYFREGFIPIQHAIARAFTSQSCAVSAGKCGDKNFPDTLLQRLPYPPYNLDPFLQIMGNAISFFIMASLAYPFNATIRFIVLEKEKQLKQAMCLPNWLHWLSWFTRTMILLLISISLIVITLKAGRNAVLPNSDWTALLLVFFVFSISMTTFSFMVSAFFSKAGTAVVISTFVWILTYVPYLIGATLVKTNFLWLLSNTAMAYALKIIVQQEEIREGLQWTNLWQPVTVDDNLSVGTTICAMLISSIIYFLITLYVEKIFPGEYGVPEKWYYLFTKQFWCGSSDNNGIDSNGETKKQKPVDFEPDPKDRRAGICIKKLRKVYANKKVACKGLTLNMYDDQITVLLGHNGAGKSTTMSMLTGMFPPTSGTAIINGYDIRTNLQKARNSIGYCPQHNILFDELTVREHIMLYSRLKGMNKKDAANEVKIYVQLLELDLKIDEMSSNLSGGMKRKLSVGIAMCGNSKVVMCDEPSAGMDPAARRALWNVLEREKIGRTILISTHFMDEADVLGDRIAIMADGELKCCGGSFFLKKRFGKGYRLVCVKNENCNPNIVTQALQKFIHDIKINSETRSEFTYELQDEYVPKFEQMFEYLEDQQEKLKIESFGVSLTTLEEVFLKVGVDSKADSSFGIQNREILRNETNIETGIDISNIELRHGNQLLIYQYLATFKKQFIYYKRNPKYILFMHAIVILFVILSTITDKDVVGTDGALPELEISLNSYGQTVTLLHDSKKEQDALSPILAQYKADFKNYSPLAKIDAIETDLEKYFLKIASTHLTAAHSTYLVAASRTESGNQLIAWFNNQPFHTAPLSLNLLHNAMVRSFLGPDHGIRVVNKPLPAPLDEQISTTSSSTGNMGFILGVNITSTISLLSGVYISFYIKERESGAKLLQLLSGLNVSIFWVASFLWDFAVFILTITLLIFMLSVMQVEGLTNIADISRVFAILLLFGFTMLSVVYVASFYFSSPSWGANIIVIFSVVTGSMTYSLFTITSQLTTTETLESVFLVFPNYALAFCLHNSDTVSTTRRLCQQMCKLMSGNCNQKTLCDIMKECCETSYFAWKKPGIGQSLAYMATVGVVFFIILFLIECRLFDNVIYCVMKCCRRKPPKLLETIDDDVSEEKRRIDTMSKEEKKAHSLVLHNLTKFFGTFLAVNQISVGIEKAECFGLLGVNGAGKTSTFKMLTGDTKISSGNAWVRGISLKTNLPKVHKLIGYCPQFDALIEDFTGRETLTMFALIRGVPKNMINTLSLYLANELDFVKHIDKKVSEYSGGNKRKLSTAVAFIGKPIVVYLDEPTTGMDPGAKRNLWNTVSKERDSGKSIVLTSHSMEECEALCTRLVIMVNGEFKCLGSIQHLKNKFINEFILTIKFKKEDEFNFVETRISSKVSKIREFIKAKFPSAYLKEESHGLLVYYVPLKSGVKWSSMFGLMEGAKYTLDIEDYSIMQTSLEQIFLSFAKGQFNRSPGANKIKVE